MDGFERDEFGRDGSSDGQDERVEMSSEREEAEDFDQRLAGQEGKVGMIVMVKMKPAGGHVGRERRGKGRGQGGGERWAEAAGGSKDYKQSCLCTEMNT